ncbi:MAG: hypothetical protein D6741_00710 [Planctomycetota bacterium]|nr:MAG: hypothetical protein D6741_00710 [Planctomycetota bacterium]
MFTRSGETVFRIVGSSRDGQLLRVRSPRITIGSGASCTLRLRARGVRPLHCLVLRGSRHAVVRAWHPDTRLNGRSVRDAVLTSGDRLTLGPVELEFVGAGETVAVDPPGAEKRTAPRESEPQPGRSAIAGRQTDPTAKRVPHAPHDDRAVRPTFSADGGASRPGTDDAATESLRRDYEMLQEQHAAAQAEIAQLRRELETLRESASSHTEEDRSAAAAATDALRRELEQLRTQLKEWEAELVEQESELARRREAIDNDAARLERERAQLAAERKTIGEQREELEAFRRKWQEAAARDAHTQNENAEKEAEFQAREQTLAEAEARLEERLFAVVERETQAEQLLEEIGKQEEAIKERESRLAENEKALENERAELESQREQLQRREQRVTQQEKELSLRAQAVGHTNALAEQREELALRERSVAQQAKAIEDRADRLAELQADLEQREATIRRLQEELDQQREMLRRREEALREREEAFSRRAEESQDSTEDAIEEPAEQTPASGLTTAAYLSQPATEPEDDEKDAPPEVLSVLRRFGKRKEEPQPAAPSAPSSESADGDDGDESVEEYMKNLLARLRGTTPDAVSLSSGSEPAAEEASTSPREEKPVERERRPMRMRPRTAPERQADLAAMRELANSSSTAALNSAAMRRVRETMRSRLMVAVVSYASGGSLLYLWMRFVPQADVTFYAALIAFILGAFWTIQYGVLFLYQMRIRQALATAKGDSDASDQEIGASCRMIYQAAPQEQAAPPDEVPQDASSDETPETSVPGPEKVSAEQETSPITEASSDRPVDG